MLPNRTHDVVTIDGKMDTQIDMQAIAAETFATLDTGCQIAPFPSRLSSFELDDAYRVTAAVRQMREARGEIPVGRKIGFTNRTIWAEYNVYAPIWGYFRTARYTTSPNSAIHFRSRVSPSHA